MANHTKGICYQTRCCSVVLFVCMSMCVCRWEWCVVPGGHPRRGQHYCGQRIQKNKKKVVSSVVQRGNGIRYLYGQLRKVHENFVRQVAKPPHALWATKGEKEDGDNTRVVLLVLSCLPTKRKKERGDNLQGGDVVLGALHQSAQLLEAGGCVGGGHGWSMEMRVMRNGEEEKEEKERSERPSFCIWSVCLLRQARKKSKQEPILKWR